MVRDILVETVDDVPRPAIAVENDYADGHVIAPHKHRRGQLISGASGVVIMTTPEGTWVMPPQRGMWIPPDVMHDVRMLGRVRLQSIYLEPDACRDMPKRCQVVGISALLRCLMAQSVDLPVDYDPQSHAGALMALIQHEMLQLPVLPLSLPIPTEGALADQCRRFLSRPQVHETIDAWCKTLGMSRRNFTRLFRQKTGLSFLAWRQQACLIAALPRLLSGEPVTAVAIDLGYDNPAAFTAMFKRTLGASPGQYLRKHR